MHAIHNNKILGSLKACLICTCHFKLMMSSDMSAGSSFTFCLDHQK
jgi:hypothetical protein